MTAGAPASAPGASGADRDSVLVEFFEHFNAHDTDAMARLCTIDAEFNYVPVEMTGKQRVIRGRGRVGDVGKTIWTGLFHAFPDLTLTVRSTDGNDLGDVVVQAVIGGTQHNAWGFNAPSGRQYREPCLFVFRVEDNLIRSVTAYWNEASVAQQLGHREVD